MQWALKPTATCLVKIELKWFFPIQTPVAIMHWEIILIVSLGWPSGVRITKYHPHTDDIQSAVSCKY